MLAVDHTLSQALEHHRAGELGQAEGLYRVVLQAEPGHADANHNLGALMMQLGQPQAGLPYLQAALEANAALGQHWLSYAEGLLAAGSAQDALAVIDEGRRRGLHWEKLDQLRARIAAGLSTGLPGRDR